MYCKNCNGATEFDPYLNDRYCQRCELWQEEKIMSDKLEKVPVKFDIKGELPLCCQHKYHIGQKVLYVKDSAIKAGIIISMDLGEKLMYTLRPIAGGEKVGRYEHNIFGSPKELKVAASLIFNENSETPA